VREELCHIAEVVLTRFPYIGDHTTKPSRHKLHGIAENQTPEFDLHETLRVLGDDFVVYLGEELGSEAGNRHGPGAKALDCV
jgi:hypothetical protein